MSSVFNFLPSLFPLIRLRAERPENRVSNPGTTKILPFDTAGSGWLRAPLAGWDQHLTGSGSLKPTSDWLSLSLAG